MGNVAPKAPECVSFLSPVNRTEHWQDALTIHLCYVDLQGALASVLELGKKYRIRLSSKDLGVKKWAYGHEHSSDDPEAAKLVNSTLTGTGNATFKLVESLSCPPKMETRMHLCEASPSLASASTNLDSSTITLEVSVVNTGSDTVTVQTRGPQVFLVPWGPFHPEPELLDDRLRIIDASPYKSLTSSLLVFDAVTGGLVRGNQQHGTGPLKDPTVDSRPKVDELVTLMPGAPVVREVDIGPRVKGLENGQYKIRMQPKGCRWWWQGELEKDEGKDGRVPAHLYRGWTVPLMLESQDEVELRIKDGEVERII
jgi:hypothetical protein